MVKHLALLVALTLVAGCGKKSESPVTNSATNAPAANADTTPAGAAATVETTINDRSLAYLKALVERKDYEEARKALKAFDGKTLTPQQQKTLDDLKAKIPGG